MEEWRHQWRRSAQVSVCVHRWSRVCAEDRITLGISDLFWLVHLQLLHSMGEEGQQLNNQIPTFLPLFLFPSRLPRGGSEPASCTIKPFIYTLLTDATSCLGWGTWFVFLNLWKRLNCLAEWYMLQNCLLMLDSSCTGDVLHHFLPFCWDGHWRIKFWVTQK